MYAIVRKYFVIISCNYLTHRYNRAFRIENIAFLLAIIYVGYVKTSIAPMWQIVGFG